MKINEIITEVWDNPQHRPGRWVGIDGEYEKSFTLQSGKELKISINNLSGYGSLINFYVDDSQQVTGTGDAVQIFSIVGNAIEDFVRKKQPSIFAFTGRLDDSSRIKLYDRLVKRLFTLSAFRSYINITNDEFEWPEYLKQDIDDIHAVDGQKIYVLAHSRYFKELYESKTI